MSEFGSILFDKSYLFAVEIVKWYKSAYNHQFSDLFRQLLRAGTSIGANIAEANGALSKNDFSAKVSIGLKEMRETKYWLLLMKDSDLMNIETYNKLNLQVDELCKIAYSILKTTGRIKPQTE